MNDQPVFVYRAKVRQAIVKPPTSIATHVMGGATEMASFADFDFAGAVEVAVTPTRPTGRSTSTIPTTSR